MMELAWGGQQWSRLLRGEALQHALIAALAVAVRVLDVLGDVVGAGQDQLLDSNRTAPGELDVLVQHVHALSRWRCAHDDDAWMLRHADDDRHSLLPTAVNCTVNCIPAVTAREAPCQACATRARSAPGWTTW